ncbi:hypothetical protein ACFL6G_02550 [candidate division KSB1 bacterium]
MPYKKLFGLVWGLLIILLFCRCSLIGLKYGADHDRDGPELKQVSFDRIATVKQGKPVDVVMDNGNTVSGEYKGIGQISQIDYSEYYTECLDQLPSGFSLPSIGDEISITSGSGIVSKMEFQGFDYMSSSLILAGPGRENPLYIDEVSRIEFNNGKNIELVTLRRLVKERVIPVYSGILLEKEPKEISLISGNEVNHVFVKIKKFGKLKGFLVGAVFDYVSIASGAWPMAIVLGATWGIHTELDRAAPTIMIENRPVRVGLKKYSSITIIMESNVAEDVNKELTKLSEETTKKIKELNLFKQVGIGENFEKSSDYY